MSSASTTHTSNNALSIPAMSTAGPVEATFARERNDSLYMSYPLSLQSQLSTQRRHSHLQQDRVIHSTPSSSHASAIPESSHHFTPLTPMMPPHSGPSPTSVNPSQPLSSGRQVVPSQARYPYSEYCDLQAYRDYHDFRECGEFREVAEFAKFATEEMQDTHQARNLHELPDYDTPYPSQQTPHLVLSSPQTMTPSQVPLISPTVPSSTLGLHHNYASTSTIIPSITSMPQAGSMTPGDSSGSLRPDHSYGLITPIQSHESSPSMDTLAMQQDECDYEYRAFNPIAELLALEKRSSTTMSALSQSQARQQAHNHPDPVTRGSMSTVLYNTSSQPSSSWSQYDLQEYCDGRKSYEETATQSYLAADQQSLETITNSGTSVSGNFKEAKGQKKKRRQSRSKAAGKTKKSKAANSWGNENNGSGSAVVDSSPPSPRSSLSPPKSNAQTRTKPQLAPGKKRRRLRDMLLFTNHQVHSHLMQCLVSQDVPNPTAVMDEPDAMKVEAAKAVGVCVGGVLKWNVVGGKECSKYWGGQTAEKQ